MRGGFSLWRMGAPLGHKAIGRVAGGRRRAQRNRPNEGVAIVKLGDLTVFAGGEFQKYDDARVGLLTHGLQYGTGCFEGIRGYWVPAESELYLVQLREHFERLAISAKI